MVGMQSEWWEMDKGREEKHKWGWWGLGPDTVSSWTHAKMFRLAFLYGCGENLYVYTEESQNQKYRMRVAARKHLLSSKCLTSN